MPKKTAYARSKTQRSKTRQKGFELVRPVPEKNALATIETSETEEREDEDLGEVSSKQIGERVVQKKGRVKEREEEKTGKEGEELTGEEEKEKEEDEAPEEIKGRVEKKRDVEESVPSTPSAGGAPKSAAARLAARRQASQKAQRSAANLIMAENYGYVRKDLLLILILALIMFSGIIVLHFVLGG